MMMMEEIVTSPMEIIRGNNKKCFLCDSPAVDGNCSLGPYFRTTRRSEPLPADGGKGDDSDDVDLWGTFILTELLQLEEEESQEMLGVGGLDDDDGGQWLLELCGRCVEFVTEFRNRYEERVEIEGRMEGMRQVALGKLLGLPPPLVEEEVEQQVGVVEVEGSTAGVRERICGFLRRGVSDTDANAAAPSPTASTSTSPEGINYERDVAVGVSSRNDLRLLAASKPAPKKGNRNEHEKDVEEAGSSKGTTRRSQQKVQEMDKTRRGDDSNKSQSDTESSSSTECVFCGKLFASTGSLNSHIRRHIGETPVPVASVDVRRGHGHNMTPDAGADDEIETAVGRPVPKPKHSCSYCGKPFKSKSSLTLHLPVHTGDKPWACEICDKRFARKGDLTTHLKTHSQERPHVCIICDKRFRYLSHLKSHIWSHTGEKFHFCVFCGKGFSGSSHLRRHTRVHTQERPFFCPMCNKEFSDPSTLNYHMRAHKNQKAWTCEICSKMFRSSGHLNSHMRVHTKERPYRCRQCGKTYSHLGGLRYHAKATKHLC